MVPTPDDALLTALPSARTLATLRDDPLEPVAIRHHRLPPPPVVERGGCLWMVTATAGLIGLILTIQVMVNRPDIFAAGVAGLLASYGGWWIVRARRLRAAGRREELPPASLSGRPVRALGPTPIADQAALDLKRRPGPPSAGFDPTDPRHRRAADAIHTCRARDGLGFVGPPKASEPGALIASIAPFVASAATLEERLDQWDLIAGFIETHPDPQAVWLAAVACREATSPRRAAAALRRLAAMPDQRPQLDRALAFIDAEGHGCARGAAAIFRADAEALSRLIAEAPAQQTPDLIQLIEARWQIDPDPALFDAWAARDAAGLALIRAELPDAGEARWRALLRHAGPEVAGQAVKAMLTARPPLPLLGARALLGRADIQRLFADGAPPRALHDVALAAMERLENAGAAADLRLLGQWTGDPRLGDQARRSHRALKVWVGADVRGDVGGLAMAADDGASGGLSPVDGGGLSPADDGGPSG